MFFVLSKTLGMALLPTNLLIGLAAFGALLLFTRFALAARKVMLFVILLLATCAVSPLGNLLLYPLESRFPAWHASGTAPDGIVVLGGPIDADISLAHQTPVIRAAADRIIATAVLARKYPNARIIFSGGSANLISNDAREADYAAIVFESLGIAKSRVTTERGSRNTFENAEYSRLLAAPKPGERWLLVTSAYHMPRAIGLFRKVGFAVEPYPVDWRVGSWTDALSFTKVATEGLVRTDIALREWIGLLAYRITCKSDDLFPGPAKDHP